MQPRDGLVRVRLQADPAEYIGEAACDTLNDAARDEL
jgi:hypothetical protein